MAPVSAADLAQGQALAQVSPGVNTRAVEEPGLQSCLTWKEVHGVTRGTAKLQGAWEACSPGWGQGWEEQARELLAIGAHRWPSRGTALFLPMWELWFAGITVCARLWKRVDVPEGQRSLQASPPAVGMLGAVVETVTASVALLRSCASSSPWLSSCGRQAAAWELRFHPQVLPRARCALASSWRAASYETSPLETHTLAQDLLFQIEMYNGVF
nr:uncharacterized protein LOC109731072 [Microcebus murinus]